MKRRKIPFLVILLSLVLLLGACDGVNINVNVDEPKTTDTTLDQTDDTDNTTADTSDDNADDTTADTSDDDADDTTADTSNDDAGDTTGDTSDDDPAGDTSDDDANDTTGDTSDDDTVDITGDTSDDTTSTTGDNSDNDADDSTGDTSDNDTADTTGDTSDNDTADTTGDTSDDDTADTTGDTSDDDTTDTTGDTTNDTTTSTTGTSDLSYFDVCYYDEATYEYTCGVMNSEGELIFPIGPYEVYAGFGEYGIAPIYYSDINQYRYINTSGDVLFNGTSYDFAGEFTEGYASVSIDGNWGFIDTTGTVVIPLEYTNVNSFNKYGTAFASKDFLWGMIDKDGQVIIDFQYSYLELFSQESDRIIASSALGFRILGIDGTVIGNYDQTELYPYSINNDGLAAVWDSDQGLYGFIDETGALLINFRYDGVGWGHLHNELVPVSLNNLWGYIDSNGTVVVDFQYAYAEGFSNGLAAVAVDGNSWGYYDWGYIDEHGSVIIPLQFAQAGYFTDDGYATIFDQSFFKYDYIDRSGTPRYSLWDYAYDYNNGYAIVGAELYDDYGTSLGVKWGVIDTDGTLVIPLEYGYIQDLNSTIYW